MELGTKITYRAKRAAPEIPKRRRLRLPMFQGDMERAHSDPGEVSGGMGFWPGAVGLLLEGSGSLAGVPFSLFARNASFTGSVHGGGGAQLTWKT